MKNTILLVIAFISFISFTKAQSPQWLNYTEGDKIFTLAEEGNYIWAGGFDGLVKINKSNGIHTFYNTSNSDLPDNHIFSLAIDEYNTKWIGTGGGLAKFDGTTWEIFNTTNSGIPGNYVSSVVIDRNGTKWIGTGYGLIEFNGTNWTTYNISNSGLPANNVFSIEIDEYGMKWMGVIDLSGAIPIGKGIVSFDGTNWETYNISNSGLPTNNIKTINIGESGIIWIGTYAEGMIKFDRINWTPYNILNSGLPDNDVVSLVEDRNGIKWIGTEGGGLAKFDGINWTTYNTSNSGLPGNYVYSLTIGNSGLTWIGTNNGLSGYNVNGFPISVEEILTTENNVNIFPNPANDYMNIEVLSSINISFLEIINMQGRLFQSQKISTNQSTINIQELPVGIYIIRFHTDKGFVIKKLIKQ